MKTIYFATGNPDKLKIAQSVCEGAGIKVQAVDLDIDEIQGEDPETIVRNKAMKAYEKLGMPVVVSDDTWSIKALNGFPGAYMKSINYWFSSDDFLRLMHGVKDRSVSIFQYLAYTDGNIVEVFINEIPGKIITEARGDDEKNPCKNVVVLDSDNGKTIAEVFNLGHEAVTERYKNTNDAWHKFIDWQKTQN